MKDNNSFGRGKGKKSTPVAKRVYHQIDDILGRKPLNTIQGLFVILPNTGELFPKTLPKTGDNVAIEGLVCPNDKLNNIIYDHYEYFDELEVKQWVPKYHFYVGQFVSFWTSRFQYDFQIRSTDDKRIGVFVLVNKSPVVRQPGREARTSVDGGSKSRYGR